MEYKRRITKEINIGGVYLGKDNPIRIQSMTNTNTLDTDKTVDQILRLVEAGCEYVRLATPGIEEGKNLYNIRKKLHSKACRVPLIADVHFTPKVAEIAAEIVEKVRINPGNYTDRKIKTEYSEQEYREAIEQTADKLIPLLKICRRNGTAIRIGTNQGSLSPRILYRYGDTPLGMAISAMEFIKICEDFGFHNLVLSMKSSNVEVMIQSVKILISMMDEKSWNYPLHLGLTEAGNGTYGRIKSGAGMLPLLYGGIGDTIRVSLTEAPENEVYVAKLFTAVASEGAPEYKENLTDNFTRVYTSDNWDYFYAKATADFSTLLLKQKVKDIHIINDNFSSDKIKSLSDDILQACGIKYSKAEYIACPSCGRTQYNIEKVLNEIKQKTSHLKNLKIGVMGCIVNGIGEMSGADYGFVGCGGGRVSIYKGQKAIYKQVPQENGIDMLIQLIKENGDWQDPS